MLQIRSRRDLSLLMERQMAAASARSGAPNIDDDIESRAALKVYLLEAHGRLRAEPLPALRDVCAPLGITELEAFIAQQPRAAQGRLQV
jgi:hypothetical protein